MNKDFDKWNKVKKETHIEVSRLYTVREIWWCRLGVNVGFEQDGSKRLFLRPVVIAHAFGPNICLILPLTASEQKHSLRISVGDVQGRQASALLSQMRVIDTRRLIEKVGFMDKQIFTELKKALKNLF
jgi:mRNA interferase MazF